VEAVHLRRERGGEVRRRGEARPAQRDALDLVLLRVAELPGGAEHQRRLLPHV
jgi:hypothetical protein